MDELASQNITGLGYWELGFRQLTNNVRPVAKVRGHRRPEDPRRAAAGDDRSVQRAGCERRADAVPGSLSGLETGAIDGQENPFANILASKLYEVQKYVTVTNHVYNPQIVLVSGKLWSTLNDEERQLLQQAAAEARAFQRSGLARGRRRRQGEARGGEVWRSPSCRPTRWPSCASSPSQWSTSRRPPPIRKWSSCWRVELAKAQGKS